MAIHPTRMSHLPPLPGRLPTGSSFVSRPPWRRALFLQNRLGKQAAALFGLPLLRVSLRTGNFNEARRRLVDNLGWVQELIEAPDLEALGTAFDAASELCRPRLARRRAVACRALRLRARSPALSYPDPRTRQCLPNALSPDADYLGRLRQPEQGRRDRHRSPKRSPLLRGRPRGPHRGGERRLHTRAERAVPRRFQDVRPDRHD